MYYCSINFCVFIFVSGDHQISMDFCAHCNVYVEARRPFPCHVNASPTFFPGFVAKWMRKVMSFSSVILLVSLAVCLAYSDAKPTNMIFMLMDDVSRFLLAFSSHYHSIMH